MADTNLGYKSIDISAQENTGAWVAITPGVEVAKTVIRGTGAFRLASAAMPGAHYFTVPSGVAYDHEGSGVIYASMSPKSGVLQITRLK